MFRATIEQRMVSMHVTRQQIALLAVVALVAVAGCSGASNQAADSAPSGGDAGRSGDASQAGGVGSYYDASGDRIVVREARMELRVENFSRAFRSTRTVAQRHGGYVGDRSQNTRGDWAEGHITVRVPPENFSAARDELAALGHVEDESVSVKDFTQEYNNREERIEDLEKEEATLERLLARTNDTDEVNQIRDDLRNVREQIRSLESEQQSIEQRQTMSTIRVNAHEPIGQQPPRNYRSSFGFDDAFLEAFYGGLTAVKYVVVFFGYAIPIGLALLPLGAFGLGLVAGFRRMRRVVSTVLAPERTGGGRASTDERETTADDTSESDASEGEEDDE